MLLGQNTKFRKKYSSATFCKSKYNLRFNFYHSDLKVIMQFKTNEEDK